MKKWRYASSYHARLQLLNQVKLPRARFKIWVGAFAFLTAALGSGRYKVRKEPSPAKRCEKMRKEPFYGRKNRLCYIELDFDRTDVIKNKCQ